MVLIEDDIHFIHAKHHPTSSVTSTTWHMCTAVVDIHDNMKAVDLQDDVTMNHRNVQVTMEDGTVRPCRGGIDIQHLLGFVSIESGKYYRQSFLQHLPLKNVCPFSHTIFPLSTQRSTSDACQWVMRSQETNQIH